MRSLKTVGGTYKWRVAIVSQKGFEGFEGFDYSQKNLTPDSASYSDGGNLAPQSPQTTFYEENGMIEVEL